MKNGISVKVPPALYKLIKREAEIRGCFIWKVLDDAFKSYLRNTYGSTKYGGEK
jgi:hypothetical protein